MERSGREVTAELPGPAFELRSTPRTGLPAVTCSRRSSRLCYVVADGGTRKRCGLIAKWMPPHPHMQRTTTPHRTQQHPLPALFLLLQPYLPGSAQCIYHQQ